MHCCSQACLPDLDPMKNYAFCGLCVQSEQIPETGDKGLADNEEKRRGTFKSCIKPSVNCSRHIFGSCALF